MLQQCALSSISAPISEPISSICLGLSSDLIVTPVISWQSLLRPCTGSSVGLASGGHMRGCEFDSGQHLES